ncbi:MAG: hypothetical protein K8T10_08480 [Candidatus Eremiobacteraeota bacterium]|nr:hypothetical protein [Candidatus Eremiobacteraeota bacterium]
MGLFKDNTNKKLVTKLTHEYGGIIQDMGMSEDDAFITARQIIAGAGIEMEESDRVMTSSRGEMILSVSGFDNAEEIREWLNKERVNEEDIRSWWNLPVLEKWVIIKFDEFQVGRARNELLRKGLSEEDANECIVKIFPIFDFIDEIGDSTYPDRALPYELHGRIRTWNERKKEAGPVKYCRMTDGYASMNALIRWNISKGFL